MRLRIEDGGEWLRERSRTREKEIKSLKEN
jgi:hypothetical protein